MKLYEEFKLWETMWESETVGKVSVEVKGIKADFDIPFLSYDELLKNTKFLSYKSQAGIYIYQRMPVNGKSAYYVGQAATNRLVSRFREHAMARTRDSLALHRAIKKYSISNFKIAIIEFCSEDELDEKEMYWINKFDTFNSDTDYNLTSGGDGGTHYKLKPNTEPFEFVVKSLEDDKYSYVQIAELLKAKYEIEVDDSTIRKLNNKLEIRPRELTQKVANKGRRETQTKEDSCTLYCKEIGSGNIKCLGKFSCRAYARDYMFEYEKEVYRQEYPEEFKQNCMERGKSTFRSKGNITLPDPSKRKKDNTDRTYFVIPPKENARYL